MRQTLDEFMAQFESQAAAELRERQSKMSFNGTLRVDLDRVYVDRIEGRRALDTLRALRAGRPALEAG